MNRSPTGEILKDETGQFLVLFVLALGVLCGFVAMSIDVGMILYSRSDFQKAADAAALAAAQELPDAAAAQAVAEQYLEANGFDVTGPNHTYEFTTPYQGDAYKIEVKISGDVGFIFGRVLNMDFVEVPARAVADAGGSGGSGAAIFVKNDNGAPDPLEFSGSDITVVGGVHSNSSIKIGGSNNFFDGYFTYSWDLDNPGSGNTFTSPPQQAPYQPPPIDYDYSDFTCDYEWTEDTDLNSLPEVWVNGDPGTNQLIPGVYCSTKDIQLSGQDITGNVSLVAGDELKISGSDFNLTAYWNDVLLYSSSDHNNAIDMSGSGGSWTGFIHAPYGRVKIQGSDNLSVSGSIVADRVTVSGSDFSITALEESSGGPEFARLVE